METSDESGSEDDFSDDEMSDSSFGSTDDANADKKTNTFVTNAIEKATTLMGKLQIPSPKLPDANNDNSDMDAMFKHTKTTSLSAPKSPGKSRKSIRRRSMTKSRIRPQTEQ